MAWLLSLKAVLMSAGAVSMAVALKISVPLALELSSLYLPLIWSSTVSCLTPPYIYIIINAIIISIVASSRLQHKEPEAYVSTDELVVPQTGYREVVSEYTVVEYESRDELIVPEDAMMDLTIPEVVSPETKEIEADEVIVSQAICSVEAEAEDEDKFVESENPMWNSPVRMRLSEKPLVSSRFTHRKSAKSTPEGGKALGVVSKAKRHETLESTWKAITEGRAMPLSRHMKKCETWESHGRQMESSSAVKKSETFKDRTNLRKEPSLSQDDLNRRVEDFIKRFNQEMRLQREQSLKKYWDMVKHEDN